MSQSEEVDVDECEEGENPVFSPSTTSSSSSFAFSAIPRSIRIPWPSRKKPSTEEKEESQVSISSKGLEEVQKTLEAESHKSQILQEKIDIYKIELEENKCLLTEVQRELEEKVKQSKELEERNTQLQRRVAELEQEKHKADKASRWWEVGAGEIQLNKTDILGTGAWGYVVRGTFRGQKVAVKCLHSLIQQPQFVLTVRREIQIMSRLRHPHLLLFIAVVLNDPSGPLIITELLDTTLRHSYETGQLQQSNIISIFTEVASALNYLHLQQPTIIHRDVSSANVLLERKSQDCFKAKLSDFGSANVMRQCSTVGPGAPVYSAPEVRTQSSVSQTPKVDVYSFGVMLAEVLLCQFPSVEEFPAMLDLLKTVWPTVYPLVFNCTREITENRPTMISVLETLDDITL